jgi:organic radical activating enzyme
MEGILGAWGRILAGYQPALSIEITRECPLRCPGCYAYGDEHLGGGVTLREVRDYTGKELIAGVLALVDRHRPLHVSIVGGEPLVRYRELNTLLPMLAERGIYVQLVTSAVREIPAEWRRLNRLNIVVSIDGLQPEHDARRAPATYARILKHIAGHLLNVHCTVTAQQARRDGYLEEFLQYWSARDEVEKIWISLYTPQIGEVSPERLDAADRQRVVADLYALRLRYPKLQLPEGSR